MPKPTKREKEKTRLRRKAPGVFNAAIYLDQLQAAGYKVQVSIGVSCERWKFCVDGGASFVMAVEAVKEKMRG